MKYPYAFLFDMDGVIVDSTPLHIRSWQVYLGRFGMYPTPAEIERVMLGKHNADVVRAFFGDRLSAEENHRHGAEKEKVYRGLLGPKLEELLVPGVVDFLERYPTHAKAIASNAEPANVCFVLESSGLGRHFDVVLDGHQVSRPKPDPEIYLLAAQQLGVAPQACVVFEDSATGTTAGAAAGARVVGLTTSSSDLPGAELLIGDFLSSDLASWLDSLPPIEGLQ